MEYKIFDLSVIEAKKMDHGTVLPIHVLTVVLRLKKRRGEDVGWLISNAARIMALTSVEASSVQPVVSESASHWLERSSTFMSDSEIKALQNECEDMIGQRHGADLPIETSSLDTQDDELDLQDILAELDLLVGLTEVKNQVRKFIADQEANRVRVEAGKPEFPSSLNMVLSGPPGTGKTTVARILAQIYKALGLLRKGHLIEAGRLDLVAEFVGQTAIKTKRVLEQALDGVLFIDEAYSLGQVKGGNDYGDEAIATLIQFMENNRGRIAIFVAGYKVEMENFISTNPGLRSRFANFINFPSYTAEEMLSIFSDLAKDLEIEIEEPVATALLNRFQSIDYSGELGNGRYVRELFSAMCSNMNSRAYGKPSFNIEDISRFTTDDLPEIEKSHLKKRTSIGFGNQE